MGIRVKCVTSNKELIWNTESSTSAAFGDLVRFMETTYSARKITVSYRYDPQSKVDDCKVIVYRTKD